MILCGWLGAYGLALGIWFGFERIVLGGWFWPYGFGRIALGVWFGYMILGAQPCKPGQAKLKSIYPF